MSKVIVYCEHTDGNVRRASLEAIGAAASAGAEVVAVLWGEGASGAAASAAGAAKAVCLTGDATFSPDAVAAAVTEVIQSEGAKGFLAAATYRGKDLCPRIAAHLDVSPFADCIEFMAAGESFQVKRPWLAGKALATLGTTGGVLCATTRLNVFEPVDGPGPSDCSEHAISASAKATVTSTEAKGRREAGRQRGVCRRQRWSWPPGGRELQDRRGPRRRLRQRRRRRLARCG